MEALIKRHFTLILLALIGLAAYFQATGIAELVGSALLSEDGDAPATPATQSPIALPARQPGSSGQPIRDRNPFDSVTGPLVARPVGGAIVSPVGPQDPLFVPDCQGIRVNIVTEGSEPTRSIAAIQPPGAPRPVIHRVGDTVGDLTVVYIGNNPLRRSPAVWLSGASGLCQALLFGGVAPPSEPPAPPPPPEAAATAAPPPPAADVGEPPHMQPMDPSLADKIRNASDTETIVAKSALDTVLREPQALMPDTRIFAEKDKDQVVGIRVFGIKPDTLLRKLGFESGDRFDSINGAAVTTPEEARRGFEALRSGKVEVKVTRRGNPVTLTLRAE